MNDYMHEITGERFTAKDFRTWAGTVLAAWALSEFEKIDTKAAVRRNITAASRRSPAGSAIRPRSAAPPTSPPPEIFNSYLDGSLIDHLKREIEETLREDLPELTSEETAVYVLLLNRLGLETNVGG